MLDRRRFISRAAMIAGLAAIGTPAFAQTGKKWVCPPCACGEDHIEHDAPGRCPGCGMPLVEKAQPAPPASGAAQQPASPQTPAQAGAQQTAKPAETTPASPKPPQ
jgi:hypothetical protein